MPESQSIELPFPVRGLDENTAYSEQPPETSPSLQNVRAYDADTGRRRGGQRPGLSKWNSNIVGSSGVIRDMSYVNVNVSAIRDVLEYKSGGDLELANGDDIDLNIITGLKRLSKVVAVNLGSIYRAESSTGAFSVPLNGTGVLSPLDITFSTVSFLDMYFVDGTHYVKYDTLNDEVSTWSASAGSMPSSGGNTARLIEGYGGRVVVSGIDGDGQNWFMSAIGDATDWDYSPATTNAAQAVAGNNSDAGKVPDIVTALIPFNDDVLIFGGDHTIHQMTGNPAAGGAIDRISDTVGIAWGQAWCKDPSGVIYFFGSRGGVYRMAPGSPPQRITAGVIDERLATIDMADKIIRLAWDDRTLGVHVFITDTEGRASTHYFYSARTEGWFVDRFANVNHNPHSVFVYDADDPDDRAVMMGCQDGYIRKLDPSADSDDGSAIDSYVLLGPMQQRTGEPIVLTSLTSVMGVSSDNAAFSVLRGNSAEDALNAVAVNTGVWSAGRNQQSRRRVAGHAMYVKVSNSTLAEDWSMERVEAEIKGTSRKFQRRH